MKLKYRHLGIEIVDEQAYSLDSADNVRSYSLEVNLAEGDDPTSHHGLLVDGRAEVLFAAGRGHTGVHADSAVVVGDSLFLVVGDHVALYDLVEREVRWARPMDEATCFGVHYHEGSGALLVHGELAITRFDSNGDVLWQQTGADIFTQGFELRDSGVEAIDFEGRRYAFDYDSGSE